MNNYLKNIFRSVGWSGATRSLGLTFSVALMVVVATSTFSPKSVFASEVLYSQPTATDLATGNSSGGPSLTSTFTATASGVAQTVRFYWSKTVGFPIDIGGFVEIRSNTPPLGGGSNTICTYDMSDSEENSTQNLAPQFFEGTLSPSSPFDCNLVSGETYDVTVFSHNANGSTDINTYTDSLGNISVEIAGAGGFPPAGPDLTITRIDTTSPYDGEIVSTSTPVTIGATGYMNDQEYSDTFFTDTVLSIVLENTSCVYATTFNSSFIVAPGVVNTNMTVAPSWEVCHKQFDFTIPASGDFDLSTTTSDLPFAPDVPGIADIAQFTMTSTIFHKRVLFFSGSDIVATTTKFTYGGLNEVDQFYEGQADLNNQIISPTVGTSTCAQFMNEFGFSSSTVGTLVKCLFVPDPTTIAGTINSAKAGFLSYFPIGYVTRFYTIISGSATSTLPDLKATIPSGYPSAGQTIDLTPWGKIMGPGSYLATATSTETGVTFFSSFIDYWEIFIWFCFGLGAILRLVQMNSSYSFGFDSGLSEDEQAKIWADKYSRRRNALKKLK